MNWFNFFSKGPLNQKQIDKAVTMIENRFAQTDIRLREMAKLLEDGTPEALARGLEALRDDRQRSNRR